MRIIVLFILLFIPFIGVAEKKITITTGELIPYTSRNLKHYGLFCRITSEAFNFAGIEVEWKFLPWKRAFEIAKNGKSADGSIFWYYNPERGKYFYFSEQIGIESNVFFHLKVFKFNWDSYSDLKNIKIGITSGYSYGTEFDNAVEAGLLKTEIANSDILNFKMLLAGRIWLFPLQMDIGYYLLKEYFTNDEINLITHSPKYINNEPVYLILNNKNKENEDIVKSFNKGLKQLKDSGKYDQYYEEMSEGYYSKK